MIYHIDKRFIPELLLQKLPWMHVNINFLDIDSLNKYRPGLNGGN